MSAPYTYRILGSSSKRIPDVAFGAEPDKRPAKIRGGTQAVLVALAHLGDGDGWTAADYETIARHARVSRATVARAIPELIAAGVLVRALESEVGE